MKMLGVKEADEMNGFLHFCEMYSICGAGQQQSVLHLIAELIGCHWRSLLYGICTALMERGST